MSVDIADFENGFRLEAMVSSRLKGKAPLSWQPRDWGRYHKTFRQTELTPRELAISVWKGYAFAPIWDGRRVEECFKAAYHIAFDFDTGDESSSLPFLTRPESFVWLFSSFAYSTPSSTPETPKSRVVFVLEYPVWDAQEYRELYQALAWWIERDGSHTDPQCKDPLRLFFGSPGCELIPNWSVLGKGAIDEVVGQYRAEHPVIVKERPLPVVTPAPHDDNQVEGKKRMWLERVRVAPAGSRHDTLLKMSRLLGGFVSSGYYDAGQIEQELLNAALSNTTDTEEKVLRTIQDGLNYGQKDPLQFEQSAGRLGAML